MKYLEKRIFSQIESSYVIQLRLNRIAVWVYPSLQAREMRKRLIYDDFGISMLLATSLPAGLMFPAKEPLTKRSLCKTF